MRMAYAVSYLTDRPRTSTRQDLAIEAVDLRKRYGPTTVLDGLNLRVPRASVLALLGPNGAGKTTAVRLLSTLTTPDGGWATVAGHDVVTDPAGVRRAISLTGQYAALDELQSGTENLRMIGRLAGLSARSARARTAELLDQFDLVEAGARRVGTYSGGMRRRLDLAASLARPVEVLFLDEPTTGLDPRSRLRMWELVSELRSAGTTVLLTTQYLEEADRLADQIAVIDTGRVVAEGTAAELKRRAADHRLDLVATGPDAYTQLVTRAAELAVVTEPEALRLGVACDGDAGAVRERLDQLDPDRTLIDRFELVGASLDDVFLALTGRPTPKGEPCDD
jgi:ABC-2 type transport system ATP-binding protein